MGGSQFDGVQSKRARQFSEHGRRATVRRREQSDGEPQVRLEGKARTRVVQCGDNREIGPRAGLIYGGPVIVPIRYGAVGDSVVTALPTWAYRLIVGNFPPPLAGKSASRPASTHVARDDPAHTVARCIIVMGKLSTGVGLNGLRNRADALCARSRWSGIRSTGRLPCRLRPEWCSSPSTGRCSASFARAGRRGCRRPGRSNPLSPCRGCCSRFRPAHTPQAPNIRGSCPLRSSCPLR